MKFLILHEQHLNGESHEILINRDSIVSITKNYDGVGTLVYCNDGPTLVIETIDEIKTKIFG